MTDTALPTLVLLPFLGATGHQWAGVAARLGGVARCVTVDLPGFGDARAAGDFTVAAMVEAVAAVVARHAPRRWAVAGHSMGGKVALALARRAEDGDGALAGLERLVLVAASPPCPEPMEETARAALLGRFAGDPAGWVGEARDYVAGNVAGPLDPAVLDRAARDVARMDRDAWTAWLERGSREDWTGRIGRLATPALVLAGERDPALGPDAQRRLVLPHLAAHRLAVLAGAGHLLPLERPDEVARLIAGHLAAHIDQEIIGVVEPRAHGSAMD